MTDDVRVLDGSFRAHLDPGFAGPCTRWRATRLDDESTWEACELSSIDARANVAAPRDTELHLDAEGDAWVLAPSTAGATLGEIVDATVSQGARIDPAFGVHILAELAPQVLVDDLRWETQLSRLDVVRVDAVSLDHVLVGVDGSVRSRGHLPWWGPRRRARIDAAFLARRGEHEPVNDGAENVRAFGELAAELLSSRRWPVPGLMFPALPKKLRREARRVLTHMLDDTIVPIGLDWDEHLGVPHIDLAALRVDVEHLRRHVDVVTAAHLGAFVANLFPERR